MILDTNALSAWVEGIAGIADPLRSADRLFVPSIVLGEYFFGIRQSRHRARYEYWLNQYLPETESGNHKCGYCKCICRNSLGVETVGIPDPTE